MPAVNLRTPRYLRLPRLALLAVLLVLAACAAPPPKPPPLPPNPSLVVSQDGMAYYVRNLRLPGTFQKFKLRQGDTQTWLPFTIIAKIRFFGVEQEGYRPAEIILTSGEKVEGEVFVRQLIEGTTDLGYWNISMTKVERLFLAEP
jgi:hypothetical protein